LKAYTSHTWTILKADHLSEGTCIGSLSEDTLHRQR